MVQRSRAGAPFGALFFCLFVFLNFSKRYFRSKTCKFNLIFATHAAGPAYLRRFDLFLHDYAMKMSCFLMVQLFLTEKILKGIQY